MIKRLARLNQLHLLYAILAIAAATSVWAFLQAERQHNLTYRVLQQTYEIQWRGTQIRERLAAIVAELEIALATGRPPPRVSRDVRHLAHNVRQTLALEYIGRYLKESDVGLLTNALRIINEKVIVAVDGGDFSNALAHLQSLRDDMFRVSIAAVEHMTAFDASARNGERILRYSFLLAMTFGTILLVSVGAVWQSQFARWKNQHLRSFSNLFAHTTTSQISALRLFLDELQEGYLPDSEAIGRSRSTARDLEKMNVRLRQTITAYDQPARVLKNQLRSISELVISIVEQCAVRHQILKLEFTDQALRTQVPGSQFFLILDELVRNAEAAIEDRDSPEVLIRGQVQTPLFGGRRLVVDVVDNGCGMTENVKKHATTPFFSTRGGNHTGMGLASIAELVRSMKGELRLDSTVGRGTSVRFDIPLT